jgi:hypothetical protein
VKDAQHAAYTGYIREMADRLLLRDWVFELRRESVNEGARAQVAIARERNEAAITLCDRWFVRTPEERRQTVVHEMLHLHSARLCRVMTRLRDEVEGDGVRYAANAHNEEEEIMVDALARAIAPFLPLPPEVRDA